MRGLRIPAVVLGSTLLTVMVGGCAANPASPSTTVPAVQASPAAPASAAIPATVAPTAVPASAAPAVAASPTRTAQPPTSTAAATATPRMATATLQPPAATVSAPTPTLTATRAAGAPNPPYARISTRDGKQIYVRLEVADSPEARATGLMNRQRMDADAGMLFAFPAEDRPAFWMKNTLLPLSIAFIATDGTILEIQDMQPLSEELHSPARAYRYALEVNQGFFRTNGIAAGDRIEFQLGGR